MLPLRGRADPQHHSSRVAARDPACSLTNGNQRRQGRKPLFSPVAHGKLPPCDARDDCARICFHNLKFVKARLDHEVAVSRYTCRRLQVGESAGAIGVDSICACFGPGLKIAVEVF